jgi:PIN domain nuclease of toxin-antitoxin system
MNILLDTQIALWALTDSPRLSVKAREWIMDAGNTVFLVLS